MKPTKRIVTHCHGDKSTSESHAYCGRSSPYGNTHPIGYCHTCEVVHDREGCILAFREDLDHLSESDLKDWLSKIKDKEELRCWCAPLACHVDVIKEYLDKFFPIQTE